MSRINVKFKRLPYVIPHKFQTYPIVCILMGFPIVSVSEMKIITCISLNMDNKRKKNIFKLFVEKNYVFQIKSRFLQQLNGIISKKKKRKFLG